MEKRSYLGPRHIMKVTCLRKEFKVWVHEDGTYHCDDQMTFKTNSRPESVLRCPKNFNYYLRVR